MRYLLYMFANRLHKTGEYFSTSASGPMFKTSAQPYYN